MTRSFHPSSDSSGALSTRLRRSRVFQTGVVVLLAVMTACAPQAPLPTQAALPSQQAATPAPAVPTSAPAATATALPQDTASEAGFSAGAAPEATQSSDGMTQENTTDVSSGGVKPAENVVSQPAANSEPSVRVLGVPQIQVPQPAVPNVIVIQATGSDLAAVQQQVAALGGTISADPALGTLGAVVVTLPQNASPSEVAKLASVAATEPDYYAVALTDDPLVNQQWGRALLGLSSVKVAPNAPTVNVAVIDSGVCFNHPDLANQFLTGWDYVGNDADPSDEFGHGCEVSGIIAAVQNNGIGIAGVSPQIRILPYRVLDARGVGRYSQVAAAIVRAVQDGAQVINLSLGGPSSSDLLTEAVTYAQKAGVVVVAAAGNSGLPQAFYPAALAGVISVGSIGENRMRSTFSNYGKVDLWAAGENVLTTMLDGSYGRVNGTSFAAPHVAGLAALEIVTGHQLTADGRIAVYGGGGSELSVAPTPLPTNNAPSVRTRPAMKNPAALECTNLGYEYVSTTDAQGNENARCLMPDQTTQCEQWDFYAGTCGQAFNFCAQQGYQTASLSDGKDPFSPVYAACTDAQGHVIGSVSDLSSLQAQAAGCEDGSCSTSLSEQDYSQSGAVNPADDPVSALAVPTSWDWRNYAGSNWLTPIKNQGGCGSCGVFSAVGVIEAALKIGANNPTANPDLSEQYMISTCYQNPNSICSNGSHSDWTLAVAKNTGLCDENCMPYQAVSTNCGTRCADWSSRLTKIGDYGFTFTGITQTYIKQLIVNRGPVAAYIRISNGSYSNGYLTCSVDTPIDHAIVIVGYNDAGGYWIMRNSWGSSWGDGGYARVRYGDCGIDSQYIAFANSMTTLPNATNVVRNGGFDSGTTDWGTSGDVDWAASGGVLYFKRPVTSPNGFTIYQNLNYRIPQSTPVEVRVDLGNTSNVSKTVSVTFKNIISGDGAQTCSFTLPPQSPLRTYVMEGITGEWVNGRIEVGLLQNDGLPNVMMDNVRVAQKSGITALKCLYPLAPSDENLLYNGSFDAGKDGWQSTDLTWSVSGGEALLQTTASATAALYQNTARRLAANSPVELVFTVKNTSATIQPLTLTFTDDSNLNSGSPSLVTCTFGLPSNQSSFLTYTIRGKLVSDISNLRLHMDLPDNASGINIVFSSFILAYKPGLNQTATECIAPSENPPTAAPLLTIPSSPTTDNTPLIVIGTVPQAETYELEIDDESGFSDPKVYTASLQPDQVNHTVSVELPDGPYYIRVRGARSGVSGTLYGPYSAFKTLMIDTTAPSVPALLSPVNNAVIKTTYTPLLTWTTVSGAAGYQVDLGTTNPPNQIPVNVTGTSWVVNRALAIGVYSWRVRSLDALGNASEWSAVFSFTIQAPAGSAPRPNTSAANTPTITWLPVRTAEAYGVQVASDKTFTKIVYENTAVVGGNSVVVTALPVGTYYYRVRARLTGVWGAWSSTVPLVITQ